jgi:hypothetical protein
VKDKLYTVINDFLHDTLQPTIQSFKSYADLLGNESINISHKKIIEMLNHLIKRCDDVKNGLYEIVNEGGEK